MLVGYDKVPAEVSPGRLASTSRTWRARDWLGRPFSVQNRKDREGRKTMVAMVLASFEDVRKARQCVHDLAQATGIEDPGAAALVTGELGNNCVEHGNQAPGLLRIRSK